MKTFVWRHASAITVVLVGCIFSGFPSAAIAGEAGEGKIEAGKPRYVQKNHEAWKSKGRIVGIARHAPAFTVTILTSAKQEVAVISAESLKNDKRAYEVWLKPGPYTMVVKASGYQTFDLHNLEVRQGSDLRIDLEFSGAGD